MGAFFLISQKNLKEMDVDINPQAFILLFFLLLQSAKRARFVLDNIFGTNYYQI
jgi:hypothetical protein